MPPVSPATQWHELARLKEKLQRKLKIPVICGSLRDCTCVRRSFRRIWIRQVGLVDEIEGFCAKLSAERFVNAEVLNQREIILESFGPEKSIAPHISLPGTVSGQAVARSHDLWAFRRNAVQSDSRAECCCVIPFRGCWVTELG